MIIHFHPSSQTIFPPTSLTVFYSNAGCRQTDQVLHISVPSHTLTLSHSHTCTHNPHCISRVTDFRGSCRRGQTLIHYVCILHATELRTINLQNRLSGSAIYTIQLIWSVWMDWGRGIPPPPDPSSHVFQLFLGSSVYHLPSLFQQFT